MGLVFGCLGGSNSADEPRDNHCLCLQLSVQPFINAYSSLFQRGGPVERRVSPLPGRGTTLSNASSAQSNNNSGMDTYRSPPRPLAYDDPRCSHGQIRRSKTSTGSGDSSENLLRTSSPTMKTELAEERCFSSSVKKVMDENVETEVQTGDSYSSSEDEDCPICLEDYTDENPKMLLQCNHDFHLCCIYEWMERSEACPICAKVMLFNENE